MRQVTITKTYLKFNELNKKQQEEVLDNLRYYINTEPGVWYECTQDQFHNDLKTLGFYNVKSQFSGFWSQGDGASFSANFSKPENKEELKERVEKLLKDAPYFFHTYADKIEERKDTGLSDDFINLNFDDFEDWELSILQEGRYSHEYTMSCAHDGLQEFSRHLAARYYLELEREYDYLTSDEAIKETIEANDYEFDSETLKLV